MNRRKFLGTVIGVVVGFMPGIKVLTSSKKALKPLKGVVMLSGDSMYDARYYLLHDHTNELLAHAPKLGDETAALRCQMIHNTLALYNKFVTK